MPFTTREYITRSFEFVILKSENYSKPIEINRKLGE